MIPSRLTMTSQKTLNMTKDEIEVGRYYLNSKLKGYRYLGVGKPNWDYNKDIDDEFATYSDRQMICVTEGDECFGHFVVDDSDIWETFYPL